MPLLTRPQRYCDPASLVVSAEEGDVVSNDPLTPKTPTTSSDTVAYAQLRGEKEKLDMELATIKIDYEKSVKVNFGVT